ncbi:MAG: hypothetical protein GY742_05000 [Hyphomicrobiales bacterium]|nr:hypothetical protein [Hyphomicrobiales bacterium]
MGGKRFTGSITIKELNMANENDEARLIDAMFHHPMLIERPVVINSDKAAIGRSHEAVLAVL